MCYRCVSRAVSGVNRLRGFPTSVPQRAKGLRNGALGPMTVSAGEERVSCGSAEGETHFRTQNPGSGNRHAAATTDPPSEGPRSHTAEVAVTHLPHPAHAEALGRGMWLWGRIRRMPPFWAKKNSYRCGMPNELVVCRDSMPEAAFALGMRGFPKPCCFFRIILLGIRSVVIP